MIRAVDEWPTSWWLWEGMPGPIALGLYRVSAVRKAYFLAPGTSMKHVRPIKYLNTSPLDDKLVV